jgi:hypothetical protein
LNRSGFNAASFFVKDGDYAQAKPQDQRERAVRMVLEHLGEYDSVFAACSAIGPKLWKRGNYDTAQLDHRTWYEPRSARLPGKRASPSLLFPRS